MPDLSSVLSPPPRSTFHTSGGVVEVVQVAATAPLLRSSLDPRDGGGVVRRTKSFSRPRSDRSASPNPGRPVSLEAREALKPQTEVSRAARSNLQRFVWHVC